jgi:rhodanese-related sulfurtransferase
MNKASTIAAALLMSVVLVLTGTACSQADTSSTSVWVSAPTTEAAATPAYVNVDVNTAYERLGVMDEGAPQIVDVREPAEWAATGVPVGAVLIPLGELEQRAASELAKDRAVYVICNSGNRSRTGSQILVDLGYEEVYNVEGGIQAWLAAALPVEYRP